MINAAVLHGIGQVPRYEPFPAPVATLREQGFSDIAEGTVYALLVRVEQRGLVDVEKVPSEKGPPRTGPRRSRDLSDRAVAPDSDR